MILTNKTYIRHKKMPDWGLGKVTQVQTDNKFHAFFINAGFKRLTYSPDFIEIEPEIESHQFLDNIDLAKAKTSSNFRNIKEMVKIFFKKYPQGFNDKKFYVEERKYKLETGEKLKSLLNQENFRNLLDEKNFEEIVKHCLSITNKTNLIYPNEKMVLRDGLKTPENQEIFSESLFSLLYDNQDLEIRFMIFANTLKKIKANKWTIQTYFPYLYNPEKHLFMKPLITQKAANSINFNLNYKPQLNWTTYKSLLTFGNHFKKELATYGDNLTPKDMIDVQSFFWCIANEKK